MYDRMPLLAYSLCFIHVFVCFIPYLDISSATKPIELPVRFIKYTACHRRHGNCWKDD